MLLLTEKTYFFLYMSFIMEIQMFQLIGNKWELATEWWFATFFHIRINRQRTKLFITTFLTNYPFDAAEHIVFIRCRRIIISWKRIVKYVKINHNFHGKFHFLTNKKTGFLSQNRSDFLSAKVWVDTLQQSCLFFFFFSSHNSFMINIKRQHLFIFVALFTQFIIFLVSTF